MYSYSKILQNNLQSELSFLTNEQKGNRPLRSANNLYLPKTRTNYGKKSIIYEGAQIYNKLPQDIKTSKTFYNFKAKLKEYLIKNKIESDPVL